jgi:hypothetical protein
MSPSHKHIFVSVKFKLNTVFVLEPILDESVEEPVIVPGDLYYIQTGCIDLYRRCESCISTPFMRTMYNDIYQDHVRNNDNNDENADHNNENEAPTNPLFNPPSTFHTPDKIEVVEEHYSTKINETFYNIINVHWKLKLFVKHKYIPTIEDIQNIITSRCSGFLFGNHQHIFSKRMPNNCIPDYTTLSEENRNIQYTYMHICGQPCDITILPQSH